LGNGCAQGIGQIQNVRNLHPGCTQPLSSTFEYEFTTTANRTLKSQFRYIYAVELETCRLFGDRTGERKFQHQQELHNEGQRDIHNHFAVRRGNLLGGRFGLLIFLILFLHPKPQTTTQAVKVNSAPSILKGVKLLIVPMKDVIVFTD